MASTTLKNAKVYINNKLEVADIIMENGYIVDKKNTDNVDIDLKGLSILPGVIDTQVHFREPGLTHKEDLATGTLSALIGGVTGVFEMPNTNPSTTTLELFKKKLDTAKGRCWTNYSFYVGATHDNIQDIPNIDSHPNCCGVKVFLGSSTGDLLVEDIEKLIPLVSNGHKLVAFHSEDEKILRQRAAEFKNQTGDVTIHPIWRSPEAALHSTNKILELLTHSKRPLHILHISTKEEAELFIKSKPEGLSLEITPQHLYFNDESYKTLNTKLQMNPPIRSKEHQTTLQKGFKEGIFNLIGSDHAPHTLEEKSRTYPQSPSGMPGAQTLISVMLDFMSKGLLDLDTFVKYTSLNAVKLYGLQDEGEIKVGRKANLTVVDFEKENEIKDQDMASKCGWTPYHGHKLKGKAVMTLINGKVAMRDGEVIGKPMGQAYNFK